MSSDSNDATQPQRTSLRTQWPIHLWIITVAAISAGIVWSPGTSPTAVTIELALVVFGLGMTLGAAFLVLRGGKIGAAGPLLLLLAFSSFSQLLFILQLSSQR